MPLQCVTSCDWVQIACHYIVLLSVIGYIWCAIHYSKFLAVIGSDERMKTGEKKLSLGLLKRLRNKYYFYNIFSFLHPANVFLMFILIMGPGRTQFLTPSLFDIVLFLWCG